MMMCSHRQQGSGGYASGRLHLAWLMLHSKRGMDNNNDNEQQFSCRPPFDHLASCATYYCNTKEDDHDVTDDDDSD